MRNMRIFVSLGMFLFSALPGAAYLDINETLGVRSRAMGGAGRAVSSTNEALYINPAGLSQFVRLISMQTMFIALPRRRIGQDCRLLTQRAVLLPAVLIFT